MNILLYEFDLYKSVGGGQTVYKKLIEKNPSITFYYLAAQEKADVWRPANARPVPYKEAYVGRPMTDEFYGFEIPNWLYRDFLEVSNVAASVAHVQIDVVDIPDYRFCGYLIGVAMRRHGQRACKVAVALHGNLSETQRVNWGCVNASYVSVDQREQWQYQAADIRYGISLDYIDQWEGISGKRASYLHPLRFLAPPKIQKWNRQNEPVSLNFIGRSEGFKGPDLFVELAASLPSGGLGSVRIIGPEYVDEQGVGSSAQLRGLASRRSIDLEVLHCMNKEELTQLFSTRSITVLPSRLDTFNLTALESLYAGCPVAVSSKAGVCRFLRENYPDLPVVIIDMDRLYTAGPQIESVLLNYNKYRDTLVAALAKVAPQPTGETLADIYGKRSTADDFMARYAENHYDKAAAIHRRQGPIANSRLAKAGIKLCDAVRSYELGGQSKSASFPEDLWVLSRRNFCGKEESPIDVDGKIAHLSEIHAGSRINRAEIWAELARLERVRGNDIVAATYDIRVMRSQNGDVLNRLPIVTTVLRKNGYAREAETLIALYGAKEKRTERSARLLAEALTGNRIIAAGDFEFIEDTRADQMPKVSIIVSLYKAANKLETFLRRLYQLTWIKDGRAEIVFVDSHSPTDEHGVFMRLAAEIGVKAMYVRTHQRETIQKAWNRGILLARGEYLSFLGVDEMIHADCLSVLAGELDADAALDWVQGNSLITEVDMRGVYQRDVMMYQRIPYDQDLVYLETCYLSWVGGMYRKNIHDRIGYYDESFGAAGDTEFKNRVLPFIKSKTLLRTLGIFLNYPEERATQSPRAELEDLRAWYLHRCPAGIEYALTGKSPADAEALFSKAIGYRKSYLHHVSSDLEYAAAVAASAPFSQASDAHKKAAVEVQCALDAYRRLDWLKPFSPRAALLELKRVTRIAAECAVEVASVATEGTRVGWTIFNDNRYEQHACLWPGVELLKKVPEVGARYPWLRDCLGCSDYHNDVEELKVANEVPMADALMVRLRREAEAKLKSGQLELARDIGFVAQFLNEIAQGKTLAMNLDAPSPGVALCAAINEVMKNSTLTWGPRFDGRFAQFCLSISEVMQPICIELSDAVEAIGSHANARIENAKVLEVAAKLMACKSPQEDIKLFRQDLSPKLIEVMTRAAEAAKTGGNLAYSERLNAMVALIRSEMLAASQSPFPARVLAEATA